jgi:guanosine-3',5'-bis(diphosphate) 3'-pyrophosphohydrolase
MIDIYDIQHYTNYTVDLTLTPETLMEQVYSLASKYLTESDVDMIQQAFEFAKHAHEWVLRLSGEQYIIHPVYATVYLMSIRPDVATIQACLMHDVIEDTDYTQADIESRFGPEVAKLCQAMVKVGKIKYRGEERNLETRKKTFLAMAEDLRVIFIKLADRIHNTQTLKFHPDPEKVTRIATETLHIHASIAKRLWLYDFQLLLENGAFAVLEPEKFAHVMEHMLAFYASDENYVQTGMSKLTEVMNHDHVPYLAIKGRMKSPYRVAQKVFDPHQPYDIYTIHDVLAFRIIVPTISDCYLALGSIHGQFAPEIKKIKDYIARPQDNGYQSLHTRVFGLLPFQTEIQIRTPEMDEIAEYGVAAHFAYAESWSKNKAVDTKQSQRVHKMQEIVKQYQEDYDGFKHEMSVELIDKNIFVYTPKWDVIELPPGATVLDFAFRVHSRVWLAYRNGTVNGRIVPIDYKLSNGEIIQIITRSNKESCTPSWINYVITSQAKQAINKYLRSSQKPALIKSAIDQINQKLAEYSLPMIGHPESLIKQPIDQLEWSLLQVYEKQVTSYHWIKQYYPQIQQLQQSNRKNKIVIDGGEQQITIDGQTQLEYTLCGDCNPQVSHKVIAKSWAHGIKIHRIDCHSISQISYDKFLECHRGTDTSDSEIYHATFEIQLNNRHNSLMHLLTIFNQLNIHITAIVFNNTTETISQWSITGDIAIPSKIHYIMKQIQTLDYATLIKITIS